VSGIGIHRLAAAVDKRAGGGDSVARLSGAVGVADDVRAVAEDLLDRYVAGDRERRTFVVGDRRGAGR